MCFYAKTCGRPSCKGCGAADHEDLDVTDRELDYGEDDREGK